MQATKRSVKSKSLTSELRKNIQVGVASILRQTDGQRLDKAGEIFHIPGIGQPGKRVGDPVEKSGSGERGWDDGLERGAPANGEPEQADKGKGEVAAENQRIEERGAVIKIKNDVRNEQRREWHGKLVFPREIDGAAKSDRGERSEIREPGAPAALHDDGRGDPVNDRKKNQKKRRNHRAKLNFSGRDAMAFSPSCSSSLLESQTSPADNEDEEE